MKIITIIIAMLLISSPCFATPKHWYKDWHVWTGEAIIIGSVIADGKSTCDGFNHGLTEGNFLLHGSHNCGHAIEVLAIGGAAYTGLHLWMSKVNEDEPNKYWKFTGRWSIPIIACSFHCTAALINYDKIEDLHKLGPFMQPQYKAGF